jgi:hypothetical protein
MIQLTQQVHIFLLFLKQDIFVPQTNKTRNKIGEKRIRVLSVGHEKPRTPESAIHNILHIYIPAGCTDVMQVHDVVFNKPYKEAMRSSFA